MTTTRNMWPAREAAPAAGAPGEHGGKPRRGKVKCAVWDLDNTLWTGTLLEDGEVTLRPEAVRLIKALDERGIVHSIASRNDPQAAMERIEAFGLADYFLYPQIGWNPKSSSLKAIASALRIGMDALAFIDDQPFELDEAAFAHPDLLCVDARRLDGLLDRPEFTPRVVTSDARDRRKMYLSSIRRDAARADFVGTDEEFLATLGMVFTISPAADGDLQRAEELTVRTNQLNSTGVTYSYAELERFAHSPDHLLLVAGLQDKYGSYGKIGLALVDMGAEVWHLKLLLMSCRVMSRGVGTVLLNQVMRLARDHGVRLRASFVPNNRNRVMYVTYRFAGFEEVEKHGDELTLEARADGIQGPPAYLSVVAD